MAIYRYGKLKEYETQKEGHIYIDQVKKGAIIFFYHKWELFIYLAELKKEYFLIILTIFEREGYLGSISVIYHI